MQAQFKHSVSVMGLPLAPVTLGEAVDRIDAMVQSGETHQVATANLDFWLNSTRDQHLHRVLAGCDMVVADGMPLVWASRILGDALPERVTGVDLVPEVIAMSARKGYRVFLLGGREGVAERAAAMFAAQYPGVNICGIYAPPTATLEEMDNAEIVERVKAAKPDLLLVSFGNPKQEKWIWMNKKRLGVPVSIGIGGSLDMLLGDLKRAPRWMQKTGLEWAMRLAQEPKRLGPRYARDFMGLMTRLPLALLGRLTQGRATEAGTGVLEESETDLHLHIQGDFDETLAETVDAVVDRALVEGRTVCLHMNGVQRLTAAGAGLMLDSRRRLYPAGLAVDMAGTPLRLRMLMFQWGLSPLFGEYVSVNRRRLSDRTQPVWGTIK